MTTLAPNREVRIGAVAFGNHLPLALIAGPCQLESRDHAFDMAGALKEMAEKLKIRLIYKSSLRQGEPHQRQGCARRRHGEGAADLRRYPREVRPAGADPTSTSRTIARKVAPAVDILRDPAFLCRQTDLLVAAARTGRVVNVKKGPVPRPVGHEERRAAKLLDAGNADILLTERGASFGSTTRWSPTCAALPIMAATGAPGDLRRDPFGAAARRAGGVERRRPGRWCRCCRAPPSPSRRGPLHREPTRIPDNAPSDGPNMVRSPTCRRLVEQLMAFDRLAKGGHAA